MEKTIWLCVMIPLAALFTGLGIFAWRRKKPMWFWSGSEVDERELTDVPAYNRANGIMWLAFSGVFWLCAILGFFNVSAAGAAVAVGTIGGIPVLVLVYRHIYNKYKRK